MEKVIRSDRAYAIAAAAAQDLNNELTVILTAVSEAINALEEDHPARTVLLDAQGAGQRCVFMASGLLNFGSRRGSRRPAPAALYKLLD